MERGKILALLGRDRYAYIMQQQCQQSEGYIAVIFVVTFRVGRRRREMYCGHARLYVCLCVCVCVCPRPHAYTIARTRM